MGTFVDNWLTLRNVLTATLQVGKLEDAAFVLSYGGNQGGLVARAFFPNNRDLNDMIASFRSGSQAEHVEVFPP